MCDTNGLSNRMAGVLLPVLSLLVLTIVIAFPSRLPAEGWELSAGSRTWTFPRDHGSHPDFRTEWWYFTGNLVGDDGRRFGYQVTFFRQGIQKTDRDPTNPWLLRDLFLGHFALTDMSGGKFHYAERASREGPNLAFSKEDILNIRLLDWTSKTGNRNIHLDARHGKMEINLALSPLKPPVLHGRNGLSVKGQGPGQASWYVSVPRLETTGVITLPDSGRTVRVRGSSWFDHEFGSNQLSSRQAGWDWFGLHLSDGRELMLYMIRRRDGTVEAVSSGTLVEKDGSWRHVGLKEVELKELAFWESERSGGTYPSRWRLVVEDAGIDMEIWPLIPDQELSTPFSTGITYWEGAVEGEGLADGAHATCTGYVELTGYAGEMGDVF